MRVYWEFGLRSFRRGLAYRLNTLLRVVGTLAYLVIQVAIWRALLGHGAVAGVTQQQMVSYAILSTCITAVRLNSTITRTVDERLNTGNIAIDLIKPLRYPLYLAADGLGSAAYQALFTTLPTLVIAGVAFGFQPPASGVAFLAFLASVALALALSFAIGYLIALCAFWVLTTFHFEWTINTLIKVFSGRFLPFWFFLGKSAFCIVLSNHLIEINLSKVLLHVYLLDSPFLEPNTFTSIHVDGGPIFPRM